MVLRLKNCSPHSSKSPYGYPGSVWISNAGVRTCHLVQGFVTMQTDWLPSGGVIQTCHSNSVYWVTDWHGKPVGIFPLQNNRSSAAPHWFLEEPQSLSDFPSNPLRIQEWPEAIFSGTTEHYYIKFLFISTRQLEKSFITWKIRETSKEVR